MVRRIKFTIYAFVIFSGSLFANQGGNDTFGYMWTDSKGTTPKVSYNWIDIRDGNPIFTTNKDDSMAGPLTIPFNVSFYGATFNQIYVSTNGFVAFQNAASFPVNSDIPFTNAPDSIIAPYWDDLKASALGNVYYKTVGTSPNRKFIVQWDNFEYKTFADSTITFQLILFEHSNLIKFQYNNTHGDSLTGIYAT
ncbi:MAG TPA: hypothetical protein ENK14_03870, partial [Caldithrix sp.]|nr:hypothetical protein [Caldithrix sp.]